MDQRKAMRLAMAASERVRGTTSPNPPVGCAVLDAAGELVAVGQTTPPGGPHAEVVALRAAGERAAGGTVVVTLEPCAHFGRTPPCVQALLDAGVAAVHYAVADPNPTAAGGAAALQAAGVQAHHGLLADEVRNGPLRAWLHWVATGSPHVTWKLAASLDGRSAAADGTSQWITSAQALAEVHALRAKVDAIVVGTGTALADDPSLTARDTGGQLAARQPLRVVVGKRELPASARLLDGSAPTLRLATHDPDEVLAELASRNVVDVMLEGGPTLAGAFLAAGRVQRVLAYIAGPAALGDAAVTTIAQALRLRVEQVTMVGPDICVSAVPIPSAPQE
jgi:diaminohydroxyphosphoribosylaminopyrimidine deaminase/5-amino-6-(5-phosphoribosylamino)uracil reductase